MMKRRDFIKCGFGGAGLAVGSSLASSADNSPSSPSKSVYGHPRWVKMIPRHKLAIDDSVYSRFKESNNVFGSFTRYYGTQNSEKLMQESRDKTIKYYLEKRPGYRLEDRALADAAWVISRLGGLNRGTRAWTSKSVLTPEQRGVENYKGTPEEVAQLIKAAARYFGAATVGITLLDRRHIHSQE